MLRHFKAPSFSLCFINCYKGLIHRHLSDDQIRTFIEENTEVVRGQMTPEIQLRLMTPKCRFWSERAELWPLQDPYWAVYWPGGQALSRYILDNPSVCRGKSVLDLGSGCGAAAIAAGLSGASRVVANDIDPVAAVATLMNCELNGLVPLVCVTENIIGSELAGVDLILLGDMFYDESLASSLHCWLSRCVRLHALSVLIGDPGRAPFESHDIRPLLRQKASFDLPESVREENYGLTASAVWSFHPPP